MKKSVVTGGDGFIGRHLVEALRARGEDVRVVDLKTGQDIRKVETFGAELSGAEVVYHLAALPRVQYSIEHPDLTAETNTQGTINVLEAARQAGVKRVVFASSSSVYGDATEFPTLETAALNPMSPYAMQKRMGEMWCRYYSDKYGLETVCLRYFNVYGPGASAEGSYPLVTAVFLKQKMEGKPLSIVNGGGQSRDFTHVSDIARATILAGLSKNVGKGESINIAGGKDITVNTVAALMGGPTIAAAPRVEPKKTLADISLARKTLGWAPEVRFEDGIAALKKLNNIA